MRLDKLKGQRLYLDNTPKSTYPTKFSYRTTLNVIFSNQTSFNCLKSLNHLNVFQFELTLTKPNEIRLITRSRTI